jgi:branched-chain amino acid transport system ATP-binding protein
MSLLRVSHLTKSFGGNRAVDDISFELAAGELLAMIGPNGAGK